MGPNTLPLPGWRSQSSVKKYDYPSVPGLSRELTSCESDKSDQPTAEQVGGGWKRHRSSRQGCSKGMCPCLAKRKGWITSEVNGVQTWRQHPVIRD